MKTFVKLSKIKWQIYVLQGGLEPNQVDSPTTATTLIWFQNFCGPPQRVLLVIKVIDLRVRIRNYDVIIV
jgi:hypothetical protein